MSHLSKHLQQHLLVVCLAQVLVTQARVHWPSKFGKYERPLLARHCPVKVNFISSSDVTTRHATHLPLCVCVYCTCVLYVCICVCADVYLYINVCVYLYINVCVRACICPWVCVSTYVYKCVYFYINMYVYRERKR